MTKPSLEYEGKVTNGGDDDGIMYFKFARQIVVFGVSSMQLLAGTTRL